MKDDDYLGVGMMRFQHMGDLIDFNYEFVRSDIFVNIINSASILTRHVRHINCVSRNNINRIFDLAFRQVS